MKRLLLVLLLCAAPGWAQSFGVSASQEQIPSYFTPWATSWATFQVLLRDAENSCSTPGAATFVSELATTTAYTSGTLLADGNKILYIRPGAQLHLYNLAEKTMEAGPVCTDNFNSSCLLPNGKVLLIQGTSDYFGIYDPEANSYTRGPAGETADTPWGGHATLPSGTVVLANYNSDYVGLYNYKTNTYTRGCGNGGQYSANTTAAILVPDGRVIFAPLRQKQISIYNPVADSMQVLATDYGDYAFYGACLLPTGDVLMAPYNRTKFLIFHPSTNTAEDVGDTFSTGPRFMWIGMMADGRALALPNAPDNLWTCDYRTGATVAVATATTNAPFQGPIQLPDGDMFLSRNNLNCFARFNPNTGSGSTRLNMLTSGWINRPY